MWKMARYGELLATWEWMLDMVSPGKTGRGLEQNNWGPGSHTENVNCEEVTNKSAWLSELGW